MSQINSYFHEAVENRRALHRRPEEGWTEFETTAFVAQRLRSFGYEVSLGTKVINPEAVMGRDSERVRQAQQRALAAGVSPQLLQEMQGYTGAVADLDTGRAGPTTAFRFDMDCVCIEESREAMHAPAKCGFASEFSGLMHACGHDAHTAVGLALAHWIADNKDDLCGKFRFIFQPAEEGTRGAAAMAAAGVVDHVDWLFGSHIGVCAKLGEVGVCRSGFLATTKVDVTFTGTPSHAGADPQKGRSALTAACAAVMMMQGIPRNSQGDTRIAVGTLHAGEGRNVTPAHAKLELEVRGETPEVNRYMFDNVERIIKGVAQAYDVTACMQKAGEATTLSVSKEACDLVAACIDDLDGVEAREFNNVVGSEDCTILLRRAAEHGAKTAFFIYGCNHSGHHRGDFDIQDEQSLPIALRVMSSVVERINKLAD